MTQRRLQESGHSSVFGDIDHQATLTGLWSVASGSGCDGEELQVAIVIQSLLVGFFRIRLSPHDFDKPAIQCN